MSENKACIFCINSNPDREKDGKIRCERFSEWRDPIATVECDEFFDKGHFKLPSMALNTTDKEGDA